MRIDRALDLVIKARAVVDHCIYASDSLLASKDGRPNQQSALEGAHDLLSQTADERDDACEMRAARKAAVIGTIS